MAQSFDFYTDKQSATCSLHFVPNTQWAEWLNLQPVFWQNQLKNQQFSGKAGEVALIMDNEGRLIRACLGWEPELANRSLAAAAMKLPAGVYELAEELPLADKLAWALGQYLFDRYKKSEMLVKVLRVSATELSTLKAYTEAVFLARDLINTQASDMGPAQLAAVAESLAAEHGAKFEQWVGDDLLKA